MFSRGSRRHESYTLNTRPIISTAVQAYDSFHHILMKSQLTVGKITVDTGAVDQLLPLLPS